MPGIVVEIDAILSQQSLAKLGTDLEKTSQQIGTGLTKGATPAALAFSKQLIATLQTRLKEESGVLSAQLSAGMLSPAQYQQAAQRLGREIAADLKKGVASGGRLDLFGGPSGIALRNQLQAITAPATQAAPAVQKAGAAIAQLGVVSAGASTGLNRVRNGLVQVALSATGSAGPLGRFASSLLLFGGGGGLVLGLAAGAAIIGTAWQLITKKTREAREEMEKWIMAARAANVASLPQIQQIAREIEDAQKRIAQLVKDFGKAELKNIASVVFGRGEMSPEMKQIIADIEVARDRLANLKAELRTVVTGDPFTLSAGAGHQVGRAATEEANRRIIERDERAREDADRKALQRAKEIARLREEAEKRVVELQEKSAELTSQAQSLLAENTVTIVDDLELALAQMEREVLAFFDTIPPEWEQAFTQARDRIATVKLLEPIDQELQRLAEQASRIGGSTSGQAALLPDLDEMLARLTGFRDMQAEGTQGWQDWEDRIQAVLGLQQQMLTNIGDASVGVEAVNTTWQVTGELVAGIAEGLIEVAFRLGGISAETANILSSFVQLGGAVARIAAGDLTAIPAALGGLAGLFGESPEAKALRESIEKNSDRLKELGEHLDQLNVSVSGQRFAAVGAELGDVLATGEGRFRGKTDMSDALRRAGLSLKELDQIATDLGIDISQRTVTQFEQLKKAIDEADLTEFTRTFRGQLELDERRQRLMKDSTTQQLVDMANTNRLTGSGLIADALANGDLGTEAGLADARKRIEKLFADFPNLTAEQLGGLTREQFLDQLQKAADLIDEGLQTIAEAAIEASRKAREDLLTEEDATVRAAHEAERAQKIMEAVAAGSAAGGEAASLAAQIALAEDKRKQLESGPLGIDSPLAQEQRRIIDELLAQLGQVAPSGLPGNVSPGFTVQQSITQSSAGRLVGEAVTTNVWLEKIFHQGEGRAGGPAGAGVAGERSFTVLFDAPVMYEGVEIGRLAGEQQYERYQNTANLNGNAAQAD